ncbi:DeoR/GlpR family DNA-binding transcription regulator [Hydrogenophaga sp. A37]|uniref:DeoR/GlpR family DNA-binding transcription regulator n=1 Tax=Hydrogenophaga sp. A37 TaxID=1945864 RepID=UPI000987A76E|nr:DeoR/GlpR family DNA-binding transcription regulator [Hydrogenophaga sp. A37]OOG86615.1 DeoR family transcriptional regulator [Hydrogenophaga sp. A37]
MYTNPPLERRELIAARLAQGQTVVATALAAEFQVSDDAIRRDLRALAAQGRGRRVYGGALPPLPGATPMAVRMDQGRERKAALARVAVETIEPGEFLFLDSSSTNLALAECLPEDHALTVATNSVDIAAALLRRQDVQLIMVGGSVDPLVGGCIDAAAVLAVGQMNIQRCFLGTCGITVDAGVCTVDAADAAFKRALRAVSRHCVAMATNDKLGLQLPHRVTPVREIDHLVVEHDADFQTLKALAKQGTQVLKAARPH